MVTIVRYTTTSTMDRANSKERSQEVSKELERTDNIMWWEEDNYWITEFVIAFDIVETILEDILNKVCDMS